MRMTLVESLEGPSTMERKMCLGPRKVARTRREVIMSGWGKRGRGGQRHGALTRRAKVETHQNCGSVKEVRGEVVELVLIPGFASREIC